MRKRSLKRLQSMLALTAAMIMTSHTATGFVQSPARNHFATSLPKKTAITSHTKPSSTPTALSVWWLPGSDIGQDDDSGELVAGLEGVQALSASQRKNVQEKMTFRSGSTLPRRIVTARRFSDVPRSNEGKNSYRPASTIPERSITTRRFSNVPRSKENTYG